MDALLQCSMILKTWSLSERPQTKTFSPELYRTIGHFR
jgi:hypothetical protein